MRIAERRALTEAEYLAFESAGSVRHEYVAGEVYAMAGGSQRHNRIALNVASQLLVHLQGKPCQVFMSDVKLHIARDAAYYYPDVMVVCGEQAAPADASQIVEAPVLVVEVLSPGTETIDRREKLHAYRHLSTLQEYALVSQDARQVELYRRQGDIGWLYITFEPDDIAEFASIGARLPLAEIYAGTDVGA
jgi:Uma2 family endonuclease